MIIEIICNKSHAIYISAMSMAAVSTDRPSAHPGEPITSKSLLHVRDEIHIAHQGQIYSLRQTRNGTLSSTK